MDITKNPMEAHRFINLLREMGITNKEDIMAIVMMLETVEEYEKMNAWMKKQTSKITLTDILRKAMEVSEMTEK